MTEFEWRVLVLGYIRGVYTKEQVLGIIDAKECCTCGHIDLEEYMHKNEDGVYCDTCWEAREEYGVMGNL